MIEATSYGPRWDDIENIDKDNLDLYFFTSWYKK